MMSGANFKILILNKIIIKLYKKLLPPKIKILNMRLIHKLIVIKTFNKTNNKIKTKRNNKNNSINNNFNKNKNLNNLSNNRNKK